MQRQQHYNDSTCTATVIFQANKPMNGNNFRRELNQLRARFALDSRGYFVQIFGQIVKI